MKNNMLLIAAIFFIGFSANATNTTESSKNSTANYHYNDYGKYFTFVEDGITFSIYKDGEFDFYLNAYADEASVYYRGNDIRISYNSGFDYDLYIQRDRYGAIIQIEDTPIYYDRYGRVTLIGNVDIYYHNHYLHRIGGLYINFDINGRFLHYRGYINTYNRHYVHRPYFSYFRPRHHQYNIVRHQPYRQYYKPNRRHYEGRRTYAKREHHRAYNEHSGKRRHHESDEHKRKKGHRKYDNHKRAKRGHDGDYRKRHITRQSSGINRNQSHRKSTTNRGSVNRSRRAQGTGTMKRHVSSSRKQSHNSSRSLQTQRKRNTASKARTSSNRKYANSKKIATHSRNRRR